MAHPQPHRPLVVLIVEDEPLVRMSAVAMIEEAGCQTYEAANADEAIALLEKHAEIRILFTDIDMPGSMDGLKLAHYVRGRWPPVKIIVTSGHVQVGRQDMPRDATFFAKPYRAMQIVGKLRELAIQAGTGQ
ncbi:MAG TPA: response regulator [Roseiarcus sp.]|jgi:CheY-like chemotaxis protein